MHAKTILAALAAPALISAAAIPQNDPDNWDESQTEIVGGVVASQGDFPFIISLQTSSGSHFCGGTLLNANTVLTAAHCLAGQSASALRIRAGSLNNNSGGTTAAVSSIKIHPNYNADTSDFDVGIVKLSTSVPSGGNIAYATLAAAGSDPASGTTTTVAGWGRLSSGGTAPTNLRKVDVPVVARSTCNSASYYSGQITNNMFCAGLQAGGKDSCQGDSGGPIINASSKTLVGVVSWGYGCAQPNKPGVYASVGALSSFIRGNL